MITVGQGFIVSWKESLSILNPHTLGIFLLLSLRRLGQLYKALLFVRFIPFALLAGLVLQISSLMLAFFLVLLVRAARPSIEMKKRDYWSELNVIDFVLFGGLLVLFELPYVLSRWVPHILLSTYHFMLRLFFLEGQLWLPGAAQLGVITVFLSPFVIVWALFMADAQKTVGEYIKAFGRAVTMTVYNYPLFLVVYEVVRLLLSLVYVLSRFFTWIPHLELIGWVLLFAFFIPYYVCVVTTIYIKRLHDQMGLYYRVITR